ncbi:MAG: hypothetical protein V3W09_02050 [Nitrososphaerales archaeon]
MSTDRPSITVNTSSALCGQCHIRGSSDAIPSKGEFIRHHEQYNELLASPMAFMNCVDCIDCHMAKATKSAAALGPFEGDVRTHLWKINTDPNASMFTKDGGQANGYLTVEFTCLQCHIDKDKDWAAGNAENIHAQGK